MIDERLRGDVEKGLRPVGATAAKARLKADPLPLLGLVMAVATAVAIGAGALRGAVLLLVLTAVPDALDGAVAKATGTASPRGSFFDSVADRVSDALLLGGVAWFLADDGSHIVLLPLALLAVSMLVSYERAKAESLGFSAKGGIMERAERPPAGAPAAGRGGPRGVPPPPPPSGPPAPPPPPAVSPPRPCAGTDR